jgi:hypothetical protein
MMSRILQEGQVIYRVIGQIPREVHNYKLILTPLGDPPYAHARTRDGDTAHVLIEKIKAL